MVQADSAPSDVVERTLEGWSPAMQVAWGIVLLVVGVAVCRVVVARFERIAPRPAPRPAPPPLAALPPEWPPLARFLAWSMIRLGFGPPRSFKPLLLPLAFVGWIVLQKLAASIVGFGTIDADHGPTSEQMAAAARAQLVVAGGTFALLWLWTRLFGDGLADLGFGRRGALGAMALALAFYVAFLPVQYGALSLETGVRGLLGEPQDGQQMVASFATQSALRRDALVWVGIVVAAPLQEELLFRGVLLRFLERVAPAAVALALNSLLFTSLHDGSRAAVFTLGLALAWLMRRTGNLAAPLLFHVVHNGLTLLALTASANRG
jgi:membrane protease YdiL (CAAX protease family)